MSPDQMEALFEKAHLTVSRETVEKLEAYESLLLKWQKAINLVGPATLEDIAMRHFIDSAQIFPLIANKKSRLADLGSGAGFPGLVLAILGIHEVHLVEADIRKATFLREVSRETNTPVFIHDKRVEDCEIRDIDVVTARALAPLRDLLPMIDRLSTKGHPVCAILLKGVQYQEEIDKARKKWLFDLEALPSATDAGARVLCIRNLARI